jgi:pyruvate-formate lyase
LGIARTTCARQQLIEDDVNRVEGIEGLGLGAVGDSLPEISFTEVP